jgi:hypothetical protein
VNAFADFKLKEQNGAWYEGLYRLKGNGLDIYDYMNSNNGALNIADAAIHSVKILLEDFSGNIATIRFKIQYDDSNRAIVRNCNMLTPQSVNNISNKYFKFQTPVNGVYDDVCADYSIDTAGNGLSAVLQLLNTAIPLRNKCKLSMRILQPIPFALRAKLAFVHHIKPAALPGNNPQSGMAASYEDGWATAQVNTFGNFYVVLDTMPPVISCNIKDGSNLTKVKSISFSVKEKISSVADVRPELNGKWLRFVRRGDTYTYIFDEHCPKGKNTLTIKASDENGNTSVKTIGFVR